MCMALVGFARHFALFFFYCITQDYGYLEFDNLFIYYFMYDYQMILFTISGIN